MCTYRKKIASFLSKKVILTVFAIFSFAFISSNVLYILARKYNYNTITSNSEYIPCFQSKALNKIVIKWNLSELDELDETMFYVPQKKMKYPLSPIQTADSIPNYNIVMILIDSWSIRTFNEETTPSIYQFAQTAQQFKEHYSGANATIGGLFSLFYSLPYSYHYSAEKEKLYPVLFDQMKNLGYNIDVFSSANLVLETTVFGNLDNIAHSTNGNSTFERDIKITDKTIDFIEKQNYAKPFFSLTFYDLGHAISIPEEYRKQFTPSWSEPNYIALKNDLDPTPFFNLYQNCIYFIDQQIKRILDKLEAKKMLDKTVIIITGDHGQEFNESKKNNWGHFSNYSKWQIQIPFIFHDPSRTDRGVIHDYVTTHYDVAPTLLTNFLGIMNSTDEYALGRNLYDSSNRYPFWSGDFTIRTSLVFKNELVTAEHASGIMNVTDRNLNPLPRSVIEDRKNYFLNAQKQKERFY